MNIRNRRSISIFSRKVSAIGRSLFYPVISNNSTNTVTAPNTKALTELQYNHLLQIEEIYTSKLSNKNYVNIPSNIEEYVTLLNSIQAMTIVDTTNSTYQLLLSIGMESLIGSLGMYSIYEKKMFDELKTIQLNNQLSEIMSKINQIGIMEDVTGQFQAKKVFTLSRVYSDYISLYGLPKFGVGFDAQKLAFVANLINISPSDGTTRGPSGWRE